MTVPRITIDPRLLNVSQQWQGHVTDSFNDAFDELLGYLQREAPKDLGDHAAGYYAPPFAFRGELVGKLRNDVPNSLYRERGRGPGGTPPFSPRTLLGRWAARRGIPAFKVADKIAKKGTNRWIENKNPLGLDRSSQPGKMVLQQGSIVNQAVDRAIAAANDFRV